MRAIRLVVPIAAVALAWSISQPVATAGEHAAHAGTSRVASHSLPVVRSATNGIGPDSRSGVRLDARTAMERLKRLEGSWSSQEKGREGNRGTVTYRLTGGDNVLVEDMGGMMTTYHLDGDRLMVTHYCGAGNQPRMRAKVLDGGRFTFEMFDITNLRTPQSYHTTGLEVTFLSDDRVDVTYSGTTDGRASSQVFQLTRRGR